MSYNIPTSPVELHDLGDLGNLHQRRSRFEANATHESLGGNTTPYVSFEGDDYQDRPPSSLSTAHIHLFPSERISTGRHTNILAGDVTASRQSWAFFFHCLLHAIPLAATVAILCLNAFEFYWQDLGNPNQNAVLQGLQYAAKAQEIMMAASLTAIVVHRTQHDLFRSEGVPLGFLTACFQLADPLSCCSKEFFGGLNARLRMKEWFRLSPLPCLLILGFALTLILGPSSAIAMIPRLEWWDVSKVKAFGAEYTDRVYFNRTQDELWPANITNVIYANLSQCTVTDTQDCAVRAVDPVAQWIDRHQKFGTKPNITVFQDAEVTRYLTSQGGPPDNSSWTVSSTIGSIFARDLNNYWDWLVENSSLPINIHRPLLRPSFLNSTFKVRKPLIQAQCQSYFDPNWEYGIFEFPHDELLTPPLDNFKNSTWSLPNDFVSNLLGDDSSIGNDPNYPAILFEWFDTASNFSDTGAPSLGAVIIYLASNGSDALATCAFDGRWAPVEYYLDPKDTVAIRQDSPNPMDVLNGSTKDAVADMTRMRMSLEWANTMNIQDPSSNVPSTTVVEEMLQGWSGGNFIFPEPPQRLKSGFVFKSIDWRLSTTLGLYLTEGLARAFSDMTKGSMLYRQSPKPGQSYVRYLNDINQPALKEGYRDGKLDWVEERDHLRWNKSILPWDEWAPQNGYTELVFTIQRNGYGYGFNGVPIKLATTVLVIYILLVSTHLLHLTIRGRLYHGYSHLSHVLILAWNSVPAKELRDSAEMNNYKTWSRVSRISEEEHRPQLVLETINTSA